MRAVLYAAALLAPLAAVARAGESGEIRSLIERLGHDRWQEREAAEEELLSRGRRAEPLLREAAEHHVDVEVRLRAARVLKVLPSEVEFRKALALLDGRTLEAESAPGEGEAERLSGLGAARRILAGLVELGMGAYRTKARFLLDILDSIAAVFDGYDRGYRGFRQWYDSYFEEDKREQVFRLGIAYNNLFLFLLSEGVRSTVNFEKAERYYWMVMEDDIQHGKRRSASCYAALLSAAGRVEQGRAVLGKVEHLPPVSWLDFFDLASFHAYASETDPALACLRKALVAAEESGYLAYAKRWARESNDFENLRSDERFQELVRR